MARCRNTARTPVTPARQRGAVLLVMLILAGVVGVVLVTTVVGSAPDTERDRATQLALGRAKEALIAYAVTYMDTHPNDVPGYLPCPDQGSPSSIREGAASGTCGTAYTGGTTGSNELGRLPWYTLGIEPPRDGYGECLWYAVSATFKNNPEPALLNWDSQGRFQIVGPDGTTLMAGATDPDLVVAVIEAPGAAFGGQTRGEGATATPTCGGNYAVANYLDAFGTGGTAVDNAAPSTNATAPRWRFIQGPRGSTFNDRMVYITVRDIWDAIVRRTDLQTRFANLTQQVAVCIASYPPTTSSTDRRLPWAVEMNIASVYVNAMDYVDKNNTMFGRAPFNVDKSNLVTGYANDTLLATVANGGRCTTWTTREEAWWKHWKDHLFYSLSTRFEADDAPPNSCSFNCLSVNSTWNTYAGVVLFAGRANTGQLRNTVAQKGNASNYLDSAENTDGDSDYVSTGAAPFNDLVYCINPSFVSGATAVPSSSTKFWVHSC
jgi:hypothetical protein